MKIINKIKIQKKNCSIITDYKSQKEFLPRPKKNKKFKRITKKAEKIYPIGVLINANNSFLIKTFRCFLNIFDLYNILLVFFGKFKI